jgi:hypothetical protein
LTPTFWFTDTITAFPRSKTLQPAFSGRGILAGSLRLPHQAIIEFVAAVTRPIQGHVILQQADALREAEEFLKQFVVLYPNGAIVGEAVRACAAYQLSWFDAYLWANSEY